MANANLFQTLKRSLLPAADAHNVAAAPAYRLTPKHRLARYAATGCLPVFANAKKLAEVGGRTNCSAGATATMAEWQRFKRRNPQAKLVCIDIAPHGTTQAREAPDVLNVGGFPDAVFDIAAAFAAGQLRPDYWVGEIEAFTI